MEPDALYQAVIGRNHAYYLDRFRRFDSAGKAGASWHWPAFFITFFWMLYRKMWGVAAAYVVLMLASYLILPTVGMLAGGVGGMLVMSLVHLVAVMVLPAVFANALYYRHCRSKIADTETLAHNPDARVRELERRGGTSEVAAAIGAIVTLLVGIAFIAMMAAISIPAYQDYLERSGGGQAPAAGATEQGARPE